MQDNSAITVLLYATMWPIQPFTTNVCASTSPNTPFYIYSLLLFIFYNVFIYDIPTLLNLLAVKTYSG